MIAVALLTCDRLAFTQATVRSFVAHNDLSRFLLLHGDDASTDPAVPATPRAYGFETVVRSTERQGWLPMRIRLFEEAERRGAEWVLFLENDVETVREFPWALFDFVRSKRQFYCLRLYGEFKARDRQEPSFTYHKQNRAAPVRWMRLKYAPEKSQACRIHWSAQPSVTQIGPLLDLHRHGMESGALTARVVDNVTYHIGGALRTRDLDRTEVPA